MKLETAKAEYEHKQRIAKDRLKTAPILPSVMQDQECVNEEPESVPEWSWLIDWSPISVILTDS